MGEVGRRVSYDGLSDEQRELLHAAEKARGTAYSPYSRFHVGAALRTQTGEIITASNVENAAYGSTICAERLALGRANAMGYRMFESLAIIGRGKNFDTKKVTSPCGSCRQMIYEARQLSGRDLEIILSTTRMDQILITSIDELLPLAFGPLDVEIDLTEYQS